MRAPAKTDEPILAIPRRSAPATLGMELDCVELTREILRVALKTGASSVHLKARAFPMIRVDKELRPISRERLVAGETEQIADVLAMLAHLPGDPSQDGEYMLHMEQGCFRVMRYRERGNAALTIHCVQDKLPSLQSLLVPTGWMLPKRAEGLYLLGGGRRHELLAAIIDCQNQRAAGHIVMLEERQQYLHNDARCLISQQEIGEDVDDFESGFRAALNVDADSIVVTSFEALAEEGIAAAEAGGRLILALVPSETPVEAIERCVGYLPEEQRAEHRARLTRALLGVMTLGGAGAKRLTREEARGVAWRQTPNGYDPGRTPSIRNITASQ